MGKRSSKLISTLLVLCIVVCSGTAVHAQELSPPEAIYRVFANIELNSALIQSHIPPKEPVVDGFTDEQVLNYFMEVAYKGEYEGVREFCLRYESPVRYIVYGEPGEEDLAKLDALVAALNEVEGFPGMFAETNPDNVNFEIYFSSEEYYESNTGIYVEDNSWGYATVYYSTLEENLGEISTSYVWISDYAGPQEPDRNSIICEEVVQALGMLNDPVYGYYSIFDENRNDCSWPSALDWAVIKTLYHPSMRAGTDRQSGLEKARQIIDEM
ncbi:MAG: DUF2927 domain-containing protein [Clostridiales bacterium]|nr:DUF2927 domain-containing protein [Clostridiales bacterium]